MVDYSHVVLSLLYGGNKMGDKPDVEAIVAEMKPVHKDCSVKKDAGSSKGSVVWLPKYSQITHEFGVNASVKYTCNRSGYEDCKACVADEGYKLTEQQEVTKSGCFLVQL